MTLIGETSASAAADLIKDGSDQGFMADVIETSKTTPVIVDFWAPWCGPCKQLGPAIERAVQAAKGKVKLVKIDIDKHPQFAGQLRVQSIPAVFAFVGGRPVDAFTGALPESQIKAFVDKLAAQAPADAVDELLTLGKESLEAGDLGGAAQAFAQELEAVPFADAQVPVLSNTDPTPATSGEVLKARLIKQMTTGVRWRETMEQFTALGIDTAVEIGPGAVLSGLIKRSCEGITTAQVANAGDLGQ